MNWRNTARTRMGLAMLLVPMVAATADATWCYAQLQQSCCWLQGLNFTRVCVGIQPEPTPCPDIVDDDSSVYYTDFSNQGWTHDIPTGWSSECVYRKGVCFFGSCSYVEDIKYCPEILVAGQSNCVKQ